MIAAFLRQSDSVRHGQMDAPHISAYEIRPRLGGGMGVVPNAER
jgi:hypothetical protein